MLWSYDNFHLPIHYFLSLVQLKFIEKRLSKETTLNKNYAYIIREDLEKGYLFTVPDAHKKCGTYHIIP